MVVQNLFKAVQKSFSMASLNSSHAQVFALGTDILVVTSTDVQQQNTTRAQVRGAVLPDHTPPGLIVAAIVGIEVPQENVGARLDPMGKGLAARHSPSCPAPRAGSSRGAW